jgi:ADP-ribosylglycohydrolase
LVGVRRALLTDTDDDVDEAAVVLDALERATLGLLLLFLLGDLGGLATNLSSANATREHYGQSLSIYERDAAAREPNVARALDARRAATDDRRAKP